MKNFILKMFSGSNDVSSKRVNGMLCIAVFLVLVSASVFFSKIVLDEIQKDLLTTMFYGGVVLLGVGIVEKFRKM